MKLIYETNDKINITNMNKSLCIKNFKGSLSLSGMNNNIQILNNYGKILIIGMNNKILIKNNYSIHQIENYGMNNKINLGSNIVLNPSIYNINSNDDNNYEEDNSNENNYEEYEINYGGENSDTSYSDASYSCDSNNSLLYEDEYEEYENNEERDEVDELWEQEENNNEEEEEEEIIVGTKKDDLCPICLQNNSKKSLKIHCGHTFHMKCLIKWGKDNNSCPTCRKKLND